MLLTTERDIEVVQAEGKALYAALSIVENGFNPQAKKAIDVFRQNFPLEDSIEGLAKSAALELINGSVPRGEPLSVLDSLSLQLNDYEVLCLLWTQWAIDLSVREKAIQEVPPLRHNFGGELEHLALQQWRHALRALFLQDLPSAKKFYSRATQLGSEYGTQSHLTIQWTYAATFFPASQEGFLS